VPEPTTLRSLADLPTSPASLAESTLVMIDCQNTYTRGAMELEGVQAALDEAATLLDRARSAGIPIIHIQHSDGPGSLFDIEGGAALGEPGRHRRSVRHRGSRSIGDPGLSGELMTTPSTKVSRLSEK
jgi:hypothetical protein